MTWNRPRRKNFTPATKPRRSVWSRALEVLESRDVPAADFLQGFAFFDNPSGGTLDIYDSSDTPRAGVTIQLLNSANVEVATDVTDTDGYYRFETTGFTPGKYTLVQKAAANTKVTAAEASTLFESAIVQSDKSILVTIPSANPPVPLTLQNDGAVDAHTELVAFQLTTGLAINTNFNPAYDDYAYQSKISLLSGSTEVTPTFPSYCIDLLHYNFGSYDVTVDTNPGIAAPALTAPGVFSPTSSTNVGRIAYLYNTFGRFTSPGAATTDGLALQAGLQLAIWELVYDNAEPAPGDANLGLTTGLFVVTESDTDPDTFSAAVNFLALSQNKNQSAIFLNLADLNNPELIGSFSNGGQGFLATELLNFASVVSIPQPTPKIDLVKLTNGTNNDAVTGPSLPVGSTVTWTYVVTNSGETTLTNAVVVDDNGTPALSSDDFTVGTITSLAIGESVTLTATGTAVVGQYTNLATVTADTPTNSTVTASNPDNYVGVVLTGSVSGTKRRDVTGNGASPDDTPWGGWTIYLYQDLDNSGDLTTADGGPVNTAVTAPVTGFYSFANLPAGRYFVKEASVSGWVRTGPVLTDTYTVVLISGENVANLDFTNFEKDCLCAISCVTFSNGCQTFTDLRGNTNPGDTITVSFKIAAGTTQTISLVVYTAPGASFSSSTASQQQVYQIATGTWTGGTHTLRVTIPKSFYQIDLVCGSVIDRFGPAGSNIFYTPQGRLISADNDGSVAPTAPSSLSGVAYLDSNVNGRRDSGELPIADQTVTLTGSDYLGNVVTRTATSNSSGAYSFAGLPMAGPGGYSVVPSAWTSEYLDGKDTVGSAGGIAATNGVTGIRLGAGATAINYNMAATGKFRIGGTVYRDSTGNDFGSNQTYDSSDTNLTPLANSAVNLYEESNSTPGLQTGGTNPDRLIGTRTTTANGTFTFDRLRNGTYHVVNAADTGWRQTGGGNNGNTYSTVVLNGVDVAGNNYARVKLGKQFAQSTAFWVGSNGFKRMDDGTGAHMLKTSYFNALKALNLRKADGSLLIGASTTSMKTITFQNWLAGAASSNMAHSLSIQLATASLNVQALLVGSSVYVDISMVTLAATGTALPASLQAAIAANVDLNTDGFEQVQAFIAAAKNSLASNNITTTASSARTLQEALFHVLAAINANKAIFVI